MILPHSRSAEAQLNLLYFSLSSFGQTSSWTQHWQGFLFLLSLVWAAPKSLFFCWCSFLLLLNGQQEWPIAFLFHSVLEQRKCRRADAPLFLLASWSWRSMQHPCRAKATEGQVSVPFDMIWVMICCVYLYSGGIKQGS